jgi:hypothetical protein
VASVGSIGAASEKRHAFGMGRGRTRHPQRVAAEIPRGNSAGTLAESGIYSHRAQKIRRLRVYAGKRVENKVAKGKMGGSRLLRE